MGLYSCFVLIINRLKWEKCNFYNKYSALFAKFDAVNLTLKS